MTPIIPRSGAAGRATRSNVTAVAFVLASTHPDLWVPVLAGESPLEMEARRDVAGDVLDDVLAEAAELAVREVAA